MNKSSLEWWTTTRDRHLSEQNADWGREGFRGVCIEVDEVVVVITYRRASLRQPWRRAGERRLQEWRWWWPNGKLQPSMTRVPLLSWRGMPRTWIPHPLPLMAMSHSLLWLPPLLDDLQSNCNLGSSNTEWIVNSKCPIWDDRLQPRESDMMRRWQIISFLPTWRN